MNDTVDFVEKDKKRGRRLNQKTNHINKQVKIAKTFGQKVVDPHRFAKHNAMDCGIPNCPMCSNPRRQGKKTLQERRADESDYD